MNHFVQTLGGRRAVRTFPELEAFRSWMSYGMLHATAVISIIAALGAAGGLWVLPDLHLWLTIALGFLSVGLNMLVTRRPETMRHTVPIYIVGLATVLLSADMLVLADEMRFAWHFPALGAAFVIGGIPGGLFILVTAILSLAAATFSLSAMSVAGFVTYCVTLSTMSILIVIIEMRFIWTLEQLHKSRLILSDLANTDPLTGLGNRLAFEEKLKALSDEGTAFGIILCDLDHFKRINDTHGHAVGDEVLRNVAAVLTGSIQPDDIVARIGGEEFCMLLSDVCLETALRRTEAIRREIQGNPVITAGQAIHCTASFGITHTSSNASLDPSQMLIAADRALYEANQGRGSQSPADRRLTGVRTPNHG